MFSQFLAANVVILS